MHMFSEVCTTWDNLHVYTKDKGSSSLFCVHIQHLMRKAATEAKVYGKLTYRQMNPAQKKYICDRVCKCLVWRLDAVRQHLC